MSAPNAIQDRVITRLQAVSYFTSPVALPLLAIDQGDLTNRLAELLNPVKGLGINILAPVGDPVDKANKKLVLKGELQVSVVEIPTINRGAGGFGKTGYAVIREVMKALHWGSGWYPGAPFGKLECVGYKADAIALKEIMGDQANEEMSVIYTAGFEVNEELT